MKLDSDMVAQVTELLGRKPRGLRAVAVARDDGLPQVIRVASLVDGKPFPTLYWLVDPDLNYRIDQLEASGFIKQMQQLVNGDPALQTAMREDHLAHIRRRDSYLSDEERRDLQAGGYMTVMAERGIGGIADFSRIRCLHTWYAAHLVEANTIGGLLDAHWEAGEGQGDDTSAVPTVDDDSIGR